MTPNIPIPQPNPPEIDWLPLVQKKVAELTFGIITIVVHNGTVTQVESTEKLRLERKKSSSGTTPL